MSGITLPGDSTVRHVEAGYPSPGTARFCCR